MAHFAEVNDNNKVIRVLVTNNDDPNGDEGYQFLVDKFGGTWIKTSYNNRIRKQYAGIDYSYDPVADVFIAPQPYASWSLDESFDWQPPTPRPTEGFWYWDESTLTWIESTIP